MAALIHGNLHIVRMATTRRVIGSWSKIGRMSKNWILGRLFATRLSTLASTVLSKEADASKMSVLDQLRRVRKGLNLEPSDVDTLKLFPMFAPASFFATGGWPGPFLLPGAAGVALTWALDLPGGGVRYLDHNMRKHWDGVELDWKAQALINLKEATKDRLFTHGIGRKKGGLFAAAMMHPDGWGPSRLLLVEALEKTFPEGYRVSIPEMSCGFAVSRQLDAEEEDAVIGMIDNCFKDGTRPLAPGIFEPAEILPNWSAV